MCSFCWGFNNSCTALIPVFLCVQWHLPLFCTQLFCCSDLSSRKVPLKVLEVGVRSSGLVPAADAVLWLLYEPIFKGTAFSHQFFFLSSTFQMCRQIHCTKIALESHPLSDRARGASGVLKKLASVLHLCTSESERQAGLAKEQGLCWSVCIRFRDYLNCRGSLTGSRKRKVVTEASKQRLK